jgi:hypothetical protein
MTAHGRLTAGERQLSDMSVASPADYEATIDAILNPSPRLSDVTAAIGLADDRMIPVHLCREVADAVPDAQWSMCSGGGLEQPETVNQSILDSLAPGPNDVSRQCGRSSGRWSRGSARRSGSTSLSQEQLVGTKCRTTGSTSRWRLG